MKHHLALLLPLALAACQDAAPPLAPTQPLAPTYQAATALEGRYIVVLREGSDAGTVAAAAGVRPRFVYSHALNGFAASLKPGQLSALQRHPRVAYIEADQPVQAYTTQAGATWGLDRIDQRALPLSTTYSYTATGAGVTAYIIDSGIRFDHAEFAGRAASGFDAVDGGTADDCNGHGTHVAGTVGGSGYGVAKGVRLVAVRVLDCAGSGTSSGVIAGVDWVTANHAAPAVANMSLGGAASLSLDDAVRRSIAAGVGYAVAAGNERRDACRFSPARVAEAMTVGATTSTDERASYSNYGNCVDWFAPGSSITSAWYTSSTAAAVLSGTSMASPHTAGVAALYLQGNPGASPQTVRDALYAAATRAVVLSSKSVNNHLLFTSY